MVSRRNLALITSISLLFLAKSIWGQEIPSDKWWNSQDLLKKFKLTQTEIGQLDQLHLASHGKLNKLKIAVEDAEFELDNALGQKSMFDDEVRVQFDRLQEARTNLANEQLRFEVRLKEIIGDERLKQLKAVYDKNGFWVRPP